LLKPVLNAVRAIAFACARLAVASSAIDARFIAVHEGVVARRTRLTIRTSTIGNAVGVVLKFQSVQKTVAAQLRARRAAVTAAVDANLSCVLVQDPIGVNVTGCTAAATIHPLLSQKRVIFPVLAGIARVANGTSTIHQLLPVVEDFIVAIFADEVVVIQATGQREARQSDHKKDRQSANQS
jgi:hypothetical protein